MNNSFAERHPELISEWSLRNELISPDEITYGSKKLYWWKGRCGHEWQASPKSRSAGEKCPICSGARVVRGINDPATVRPDLMREWSPKNSLDPSAITVGSGKEVLWHCKRGHEWTAAIKRRSQGTGCPYCSHNLILVGYNDLASQQPQLVAQWS